jgi:hypothetical protein
MVIQSRILDVMSIQNFIDQLKHKQKLFETDYQKFAKMRGFKTFNDWPYHRRGFLECWAEPGFHRFWQVWNPGIAYFVYHLYLRLGGRKKWIIPTLMSFILCGVVHTLVAAPFLQRWSFSVIGAFTCFGIITILSRKAAPILKQERWPFFINTIMNIGFVIGSFNVGFRIDHLLAYLGMP